MDEHTCMVEVARFFMSFTQKRILRKVRAVPGRYEAYAGDPGEDRSRQMAKMEDLDLSGGTCGHDRRNWHCAVLERVRHFRSSVRLKYSDDEYVEHVIEQKCACHSLSRLLRKVCDQSGVL